MKKRCVRVALIVPNRKHGQCEGIGRDCNDCIGDIVEMLTPRSHFLAFIDNEGADIKWPAVQSLVQRKGDIWITFQTSEIRRTVQSSAVRVS